MIFEASLPADPLVGSHPLPTIDILIPCHRKDIALLPVALAGAVAASANPVARVRVVCPRSDWDVVSRVWDLGDPAPGVSVSIEIDDEIVDDPLLQIVEQSTPIYRRGWVIQQLVKVLGSMATYAEATLVVDADTVLLRERTWVTTSGRQLLPPVHEFHQPYAIHTRRVWGGAAQALPVSFVAHHMLLQRDILQLMFGEELNSSLTRWISTLDWRTGSPGSEYHSYGTWLLRNLPDRVALGQWANKSIALGDEIASGDPSAVLAMLRTRLTGAYSVSRHDWQTENSSS